MTMITNMSMTTVSDTVSDYIYIGEDSNGRGAYPPKGYPPTSTTTDLSQLLYKFQGNYIE